MTFKDIPIGARFRQANHQPGVEWVKVEPQFATATHGGYNAQTADGKRVAKIGHSTKVVVPPYGDTTKAKRQKSRYASLKAAFLAAGWSSRAEFDTAVIHGVVAIPRKQMSGEEFATAIDAMAVEE